MFTSPSQILCTVFGVNIYCYGVIMAVAICVGTFVADYIGTKYFDLKKETIIDLSPYLIIFGIIGARLYYCLMDFDFYLRFPTEILAVRHGGISIHGAILGGTIGLWIFSLRHKLSVSKLCDVCAIGLPLAQSIGRWGNFFNSEAYGTPTNLPWKLFIAPQYRVVPFQNFEFFHPTFLYESILDFILFGILFVLAKKKYFNRNGQIALLYLILYSIIRIFIEICRIDSILIVQGIPIAILVSVCIIVVSTIFFIKNMIKKEGNQI